MSAAHPLAQIEGLRLLSPPSPALTSAIARYRQTLVGLEEYNRELLRLAQSRQLTDEEFQRALALQSNADAARTEMHRLVEAQYIYTRAPFRA